MTTLFYLFSFDKPRANIYSNLEIDLMLFHKKKNPFEN